MDRAEPDHHRHQGHFHLQRGHEVPAQAEKVAKPDAVPGRQDVKARRHKELHEMFRQEAAKLNAAQIGQIQLVLVEGVSMVDLKLQSALFKKSYHVYGKLYTCV